MSISEPFIRRPAGTSLLAAGLFLAGIVAYHFLPVAPIPRVDFPMITVSAALPGADPAAVAATVAAPLERRLGQISGVSEITSVSTLGGTAISIQFSLDRNVDGAARDVQAAINAAAGDLPFNLPAPPTYRKVNPADAPIMILAMTSATLPATQIYDYADTILAQRLSQVEGVSQVFISGAAKERSGCGDYLQASRRQCHRDGSTDQSRTASPHRMAAAGSQGYADQRPDANHHRIGS